MAGWHSAGAILAAGYFTPYGGFAINGPTVGAGVAAELTCAGVFVSNRKLDDVVKNDILRLSPLTKWNSYDLNMEDKSVAVTALGIRTRVAVYRPGIGCTLLVDDTAQTLRAQAKGIPEAAMSDSPDAWPKGDTVDLTTPAAGVDRAALDKAVDDAFTDETPAREIDTRAIVVVYDGHIVAERYAAGYDKNTRFLGWSESKSMTATLIGTLIASGKLALDAPAPVAEWKGAGDKRGAITLRNLLNMSSGLAFNEPYDPGSDSTQMLFQEHDMAAYAASKPLARTIRARSGPTRQAPRISCHASRSSNRAGRSNPMRLMRARMCSILLGLPARCSSRTRAEILSAVRISI